MVDISSQEKKINIKIQSGSAQANVSVTQDTAQYYSEKSREWAISNRIVDNIDYSSKYYAEKSKESETKAENYERSVIEKYNSFVETSNQATSAIIDEKTNAIEQIGNKKNESILEINNETNSSISAINLSKENAKTEISNSKDSAISQINNTGISTRANVDLSNLSEIGEKHFVNKTQITNCLTEIPNRINIELNDGVFTLKKGSVVTVPNGVNVFDEITLKNDMSFTFSGEVNTTCTMYLAANGGRLYMYGGTPVSGEGDPEPGYQKYNTTANKVYRASSSGALTQLSFPIARVVAQGTSITEILEVFDGFGYIGSTIWAERGVKGLIADGRNVDGTCKNIPFETTKVVTRTYATSVQGNYEPCVRSSESTFYSPRVVKLDSDNFLYSYTTGGVKQERVTGVPFCKANFVDGIVTSFEPYTAFRAIDANEFNHALLDSDKAEITSWGFPSGESTSITIKASKSTYTAPANGYFQASKLGCATTDWMALTCSGLVVETKMSTSAAGDSLHIFIPCKKGASVKFEYNLTTLGTLKFVYAEGAK